jgi:peptidoglycan/LPS O-acetylase OafA/YrhL
VAALVTFRVAALSWHLLERAINEFKPRFRHESLPTFVSRSR